MPTLLIQDGFKFFFYANEHLPMHIHVEKAGGYVKINLQTLAVEENHLKPADLRKALEITNENSSEFERKWNEFFNKG
jgi:hypothetical protein